HRRQSLPRLAHLTRGLEVKHSSVWLSPDRRWLLYDDSFDSAQVIATSIDGKRHFSFDAPGGLIGWMGDSRHWVVRAFDGNDNRSVTMYDRQARARIPLGNINLSGIPEGYPCVISGGHYMADITRDNSGMSPFVDVYEGSFKHLDHPAHKYTISLPPNS